MRTNPHTHKTASPIKRTVDGVRMQRALTSVAAMTTGMQSWDSLVREPFSTMDSTWTPGSAREGDSTADHARFSNLSSIGNWTRTGRIHPPGGEPGRSSDYIQTERQPEPKACATIPHHCGAPFPGEPSIPASGPTFQFTVNL